MKHIFYLMAIAPIMYELMTISNPKKIVDFVKSYKGKGFDDYTSTQKTFSILQLGYMAWVFVGMLSFQWPVFVLMFAIGMINKGNVYAKWIDGVICLISLLFVVLNAYHFKIDLYPIIKDFILGL